MENGYANYQQFLWHPCANYFFDAEQLHVPHIHAQYQGKQAQFAIDSGELLAGGLPRSQTRLVQAWIEIHQGELAAAWELAVNGL